MQGCRNSNKKIYSNYECSFHQEKLRTACNSINHTQPLPAWRRLLPSWSWLNTTNLKFSLLVKTSENFTSGNAFLIKLPTPQEELQGKCQEYALGGKNPTEVCQTITLIRTWKQFTDQNPGASCSEGGWCYPPDKSLNSLDSTIILLVSLTLICCTVNYLAWWIALSSFWTTGAW